MTTQPTRRPRAPLLLGSALAALLAPGLERQAEAQAFNAAPAVAAGSVDISRGPGTDVITVNSPSAIIDWRLNLPSASAPPATFVFLPAGNVATYQNGSNVSDFAVLNRIVPAGSAIQFDGTVISRLNLPSGTVPGGTVAFYSPDGIILSGSAVFDVGSLLLTTIRPLDTPNGDFFLNNRYELNGAVNTASFITVSAGALISAPSEGSYVALVAPRILQQGTVRVNGSAAYVAAESVDLTINDGLFDIQVEVGTSASGAPLNHQGTTGGPASSGAGDNHRIYMVGVPRSTAFTLFLMGNAGFDAATSAAVENGRIVLSAGYNVSGSGNLPAGATPASSIPATVDIRQANITSNVEGIATTSTFATAFAGQTLNFSGDVTLISPNSQIGAQGGTVNVGGNATATTGLRDFGDSSTSSGSVQIFARQGGMLNIAGNANAIADTFMTVTNGGRSATGGNASIATDAAGSAINIGGSAEVSADAIASATTLQLPTLGRGGTARITASGGDIKIGGGASVHAVGNPSSNLQGLADGPDGTGGSASIQGLGGGTVAIAGSARIDASAFGGANSGAGDLSGGTGQGGFATLSAGEASSVTINGSATVIAAGTGGDATGAARGGDGTGGSATISAQGDGLVSVGGRSTISADGEGGDVEAGAPSVSGGAGRGGRASVTVFAVEGSVALDGGVDMSADGLGGDGPTGGLGRGGVVLAQITNSQFSFGAASTATTDGQGGAALAPGERGGDGIGGEVAIRAESGTATSRIAGAALAMSSDGLGGAGGDGGSTMPGGRGGDGTGGSVTLNAGQRLGTVEIGAATLSAAGTGGTGGSASPGAGGAGGNGAGGTARIVVGNEAAAAAPAGSMTLGSASIATTGTGGAGGTGSSGGTGGNATGGTASAEAVQAPLQVTGTLQLNSDAVAGVGGLPGANGQATGGRITLSAGPSGATGPAGTLTAGTVSGTANSFNANSTVNVPGIWQVSAFNGAVITSGTMNLAARAVGTATSLPPSTLQANDAVINVTGNASFFATANIQIGAVGSGRITGGNLTFRSGRDIIINHNSPAPGAVTIGGASLVFELQGSFFAAPATLLQGTSIRVAADLNATLATTTSSGPLQVLAGNLISFTAPATGTSIGVAGGDVNLSAAARLGSSATTTLQVQAARTYNAAVGSIVTGDRVSLLAGANGNFAQTTAGTSLLVQSNATATVQGALTAPQIQVTAQDISVLAAGRIGDASSDAVTVTAVRTYNSAAGSLVTGGTVTIAAGGNASLAATTATTALTVQSGAIATIRSTLSAPRIQVTAQDIVLQGAARVGTSATTSATLNATRNYDAALGSLVTGTAVTITAGGDAAVAETNATSAVSVEAGGALTLRAPVTAPQIQLGARDIVLPGTARVGNAGTTSLTLTATRDYTAAAGSVVTGNTVAISAGGNASLAETNAGSAVTVQAGGTATVGAALSAPQIQVTAQDVSVAAAGRVGNSGSASATLTASRNYDAADGSVVTAGQVTIAAGAAARLAQTTGGAALNVTAGGTATLAGAATANEVRITAADIALPASGSLGTAATQLVRLTAQPGAAAATFGGTAQGPGFTLSADEAGRIRTGLLQVVAPIAGGPAAPAAGPSLVVSDATVSVTRIGSLELSTPGVARVSGALLYTDAAVAAQSSGIQAAAANDSSVRIDAGQRIEVITGAGSVRVRDAAGLPGGILALTSPDIWIVSDALYQRLVADRDFAGRDEALLVNDGADTPRGHVEGGRISINVGRSLFVQNTGTANSFGGLTAGARGLDVVPTGQQPVSVLAFGRRINADGSETTGEAFFREVTFNTSLAAGYTAQSEFNRCNIISGKCGGGPVMPAVPNLPDFGDAVLPDPGDSSSSSSGGFDGFRFDLIELGEFTAEPLIDEPVTSGSESTFWTDPDDEEEDEEEEEEAVTGAATPVTEEQ
jgi:hypothetical protein